MPKSDFKRFCSPEVQAAAKAKAGSDKWEGNGRAFEDPEAIIAAIAEAAHRLAAQIQLEGGCRAEGVGFPRSRHSKASIRLESMLGIKPDPYFADGRQVGEIMTTEKGGYACSHYISVATYFELEAYIKCHRCLSGRYSDYIRSINTAAVKAGQQVPKRGSHAFKHNFAMRFFAEAIAAGKSETSASVETSRRCSHRRGDVFRTFYSGGR